MPFHVPKPKLWRAGPPTTQGRHLTASSEPYPRKAKTLTTRCVRKVGGEAIRAGHAEKARRVPGEELLGAGSKLAEGHGLGITAVLASYVAKPGPGAFKRFTGSFRV